MQKCPSTPSSSTSISFSIPAMDSPVHFIPQFMPAHSLHTQIPAYLLLACQPEHHIIRRCRTGEIDTLTMKLHKRCAKEMSDYVCLHLTIASPGFGLRAAEAIFFHSFILHSLRSGLHLHFHVHSSV